MLIFCMYIYVMVSYCCDVVSAAVAGLCNKPAAHGGDDSVYLLCGLLRELCGADDAGVKRTEDVPLVVREGVYEAECPEAVCDPQGLHYVEVALCGHLVPLRRVGLAHKEGSPVAHGVPVKDAPQHLHHLPQLSAVLTQGCSVHADSDSFEAARQQRPAVGREVLALL